jgi:biotin synthase
MDYQPLAKEVIQGKAPSLAEALKLINTPDEETFEFLAAANQLRKLFKGNKIKLCAIVNAKSGRCSENCSFCAQSAHHKTEVKGYPLLSGQAMYKAAKSAEQKMSATCFSIVTSGKSILSESEMETIAGTVNAINQNTALNRCVSLGILNQEQIRKLKKAGLKRLHHNLETAESFFDQMCTTHTYKERLAVIKTAKAEGLEVCSGGIFGLGESLEQRVELAFALSEIGVDSVPINILHPIAGTVAAKNYKPMSPLEVLRLVATYRFLLPKADIGVFGGRENALRDLQPLMFLAGANVTLIGDYLTTKGQAPTEDLQMIKDLGLEIDH